MSVRRLPKFAKARRVAGRMNSYEAEYEALFLGQLVHGYEAITLRLGADCRFTPDFFVIAGDDVLEFHEVKGSFIRDDAKVKLRVAAEMYPMFRFRMFAKQPKKLGGLWLETPFGLEDAA